MQQLTVWIYKGSRRAETYLYVAEEDDFSRVPAELLEAMERGRRHPRPGTSLCQSSYSLQCQMPRFSTIHN